MHRKTFRISDELYETVCEYARGLGKKEGDLISFAEAARRLMTAGLTSLGYTVPEEKKRSRYY